MLRVSALEQQIASLLDADARRLALDGSAREMPSNASAVIGAGDRFARQRAATVPLDDRVRHSEDQPRHEPRFEIARARRRRAAPAR